jgi:hypothetical protein
MDTKFLIQVTNNLYRLTLFFPDKEPLKYKMREKANDILANSNNSNKYAVINLLLEDLETLNLFFEVAKEQDWVNISDIDVVQTGYLNLKKELKKWKELNSLSEALNGIRPHLKQDSVSFSKTEFISERQQKILEFIKKKNGNRVQVHQVQELFPELTKRTLRRDFADMFNQGLIKRIGEKKNEFSYEIVGT